MSTPTLGSPVTLSTPEFDVVRRMFEEVFGRGEVELVDRLCSSELVEHQFGMAGSGADAIRKVKRAVGELRSAVPDITFTIQDAVQSGNLVWVRAEARGTASGPFFGAPSGRPIRVTVIDVVRVVDGQIVEHWGVPDRFALLAQTGLLDRLAVAA